MTTLNTLLAVAEQKLLTIRACAERVANLNDHVGQKQYKALVLAMDKAIEDYFNATRFPYSFAHQQEGVERVAAFDKARAEKEAEGRPPEGFRMADEFDLQCLPHGAIKKPKGTAGPWMPSYKVGLPISELTDKMFDYAVPIKKIFPSFSPGGE